MSDRSDPSGTTESTALESAGGMIGAAAGGVLGWAIGGPPGSFAGSVVGAGISPQAERGLRWIGEAVRTRRIAHAAQMFEGTARILDVDGDELTAMIGETPARTALAELCLSSAADAVFLDKITALARVLANALDDDTKLDESFLLAAAIGAIEAPHVRALGVMYAKHPYGEQGPVYRTWSEGDLKDRLGIGAGPLRAIMGTLVREGLAQISRNLDGAFRSFEGYITGRDNWVGQFGAGPAGEQTWDVSPYGVRVFELLDAAGPDLADHEAT